MRFRVLLRTDYLPPLPSPGRNASSQHLLGVYVEGMTLDMNMLKRYLDLPPMDQLYGELLSVINHPPRLLAQLLQVCVLGAFAVAFSPLVMYELVRGKQTPLM